MRLLVYMRGGVYLFVLVLVRLRSGNTFNEVFIVMTEHKCNKSLSGNYYCPFTFQDNWCHPSIHVTRQSSSRANSSALKTIIPSTQFIYHDNHYYHITIVHTLEQVLSSHISCLTIITVVTSPLIYDCNQYCHLTVWV